MIEIKQWLQPDITAVLSCDNQYSSSKYHKYSVLFDQQILVVQECDEEGRVGGYGARQGKYYGLRKIDERIEVCIPKFGWIPVYDEIQEKYNNEIADKTILGD